MPFLCTFVLVFDLTFTVFLSPFNCTVFTAEETLAQRSGIFTSAGAADECWKLNWSLTSISVFLSPVLFKEPDKFLGLEQVFFMQEPDCCSSDFSILTLLPSSCMCDHTSLCSEKSSASPHSLQRRCVFISHYRQSFKIPKSVHKNLQVSAHSSHHQLF